MPSKAVIDAVEARLAANWTSTPYFGGNVTGDPPIDGSPYLIVQFPVANGQQITVGAPGNNVYREEGVIRFVLHVQRGQGLSQGLGWADALAAIFRGQKFSGVNCWAPSPPVLDDANDRGNFEVLSFVIPYYRDDFG